MELKSENIINCGELISLYGGWVNKVSKQEIADVLSVQQTQSKSHFAAS